MTTTATVPAGSSQMSADDQPRSPGGEARLRRHLLGRTPTDLMWGWVGPLLVAGVAGLLRFWRLDQPHQLVFDETYYVKQAYTLLQTGFENKWPEDPDQRFTTGAVDIYLPETDRAVHPPVGKWMIAFGEWLFGADSSFGWRFSAALVGTLSVLVLARTARRLFGSTLLGVTAGLLLAVDGHHLVHSRTSLLDIFLSFWVLCAFAALVLDRDHSRRRLARAVAARRAVGQPPGRFGPSMGWRPLRLVAAVCLGLACGVKWSGLYYLAGFLVMSVLWDVGARRAAGVRRWWWGAVVRDGLPAAATTLPLALAVYTASWAGWFRADASYLRQYAAQNPRDTPVPDALRSLWAYHRDMYEFHRGLTSDHTYMSNPWSWLVQGRPTSFFYEAHEKGQAGCVVDTCSKAITSLGNPVVWWCGTLAIAVLLVMWAGRRDWRAGAVLAGLGSGYLPWFQYQERTIYAFYAVAFTPFVVLGLTYTLGLVLGPRTAPPGRRLAGAAAAGAVVVLAVLATAWFWPVLTAEVIPQQQWRMRMWLPSWV